LGSAELPLPVAEPPEVYVGSRSALLYAAVAESPCEVFHGAALVPLVMVSTTGVPGVYAVSVVAPAGASSTEMGRMSTPAAKARDRTPVTRRCALGAL
jgi:hypothetical protein